MRTHTIRLSPASPGKYSAALAGLVIVADSASAIADAAKLIIAAGADERDMLHVDCGGDVSIADMPLHRLVAPLPPPPRHSDIKRQFH
jgi:hypothetical protein